jgi:glycosyltransferase involved in cell wall biosynthesis
MELIIQENSKPTLCLNMIVKNESKVIDRLLESARSVIDCYCICDTGSTDNTIEIIESFFKLYNIPGKIVHEPFKNFAHNRNFALKSCLGMSDYVLLLDADMVLQNGENFNKSTLLKGDSFHILQGNNDFYYQNVRIVKNNPGFSYVGVTHEFIATPPNNIMKSIEKNDLFILDVGDGGSKENKYERDIKLLTQALEEDSNTLSDRHTFYLANSYHDCGQFEKAIETYKKRIKIGGWNQEVWYSYYRVGLCYKNLGKMADAIYYWMEGYDYYPDRIENLYEIITYYRCISKHKLCKFFYDLAKSVLTKNINRDSFLFLHNDVYVYKIDYEYSIFSSYLQNYNINKEVISIFNHCNDTNITNNVLSNMKFYKDVLKPNYVIDLDYTANYPVGNRDVKFYSSSSSILPKKSGDGYYMNIRCVSYRIDSNGYYLDCEQVITANKFVELNNHFKIVNEQRFFVEDDRRLYLGVEDIRIYPNDTNDEVLEFIGTGYHKNNTIGIVYGTYDKESESLTHNEVKPSFTKSDCEKNWVNVVYKNKNHIIYKWRPLQICKINKETNLLELIESRENMPKIFKHVRGSTCGVTFEQKIWFILHIVSYEQPRHYYHMFAVFDLNMNLEKYSAPFKFEGEPIEYCIGLLVEKDRFVVPYSTWDRTTKLAIYDKSYIDSLTCY